MPHLPPQCAPRLLRVRAPSPPGRAHHAVPGAQTPGVLPSPTCPSPTHKHWGAPLSAKGRGRLGSARGQGGGAEARVPAPGPRARPFPPFLALAPGRNPAVLIPHFWGPQCHACLGAKIFPRWDFALHPTWPGESVEFVFAHGDSGITGMAKMSGAAVKRSVSVTRSKLGTLEFRAFLSFLGWGPWRLEQRNCG